MGKMLYPAATVIAKKSTERANLMSPNVLRYAWIIFGVCVGVVASSVGRTGHVVAAPGAKLPPAAKVKIDFAQHIKPIL